MKYCLAVVLSVAGVLLTSCGSNEQTPYAGTISRVANVRPGNTIYWQPAKIVLQNQREDEPYLYLPVGDAWGLSNDTCGARVTAATIGKGTMGDLQWYEWSFKAASPGPFRCVYVAHDRVTKQNGRLIVVVP
jgi:hypothetical protein